MTHDDARVTGRDVQCAYCEQWFESIGMNDELQHNWLECSRATIAQLRRDARVTGEAEREAMQACLDAACEKFNVRPLWWAKDALAEAMRTYAAQVRARTLEEVVPHGWRLVPIEPTAEMQKAGFPTMNDTAERGAHPYTTYQAMLAASPPPPITPPKQEPDPAPSPAAPLDEAVTYRALIEAIRKRESPGLPGLADALARAALERGRAS